MPQLKYQNKRIIDSFDWDDLVIQTYGKPYCFQQQDGCQSRGTVSISIPSPYSNDKSMHNSIPEKVNGEQMGVKFDVWLARDPNQPLEDEKDKTYIDMFWERNFYPDLHTLANDMYNKGLIEMGDYIIDIDW
jgi:hypothetical protein